VNSDEGIICDPLDGVDVKTVLRGQFVKYCRGKLIDFFWKLQDLAE